MKKLGSETFSQGGPPTDGLSKTFFFTHPNCLDKFSLNELKVAGVNFNWQLATYTSRSFKSAVLETAAAGRGEEL